MGQARFIFKLILVELSSSSNYPVIFKFKNLSLNFKTVTFFVQFFCHQHFSEKTSIFSAIFLKIRSRFA